MVNETLHLHLPALVFSDLKVIFFVHFKVKICHFPLLCVRCLKIQRLFANDHYSHNKSAQFDGKKHRTRKGVV